MYNHLSIYLSIYIHSEHEADLCSGGQQGPCRSLGGASGQVVRKVGELYGHRFNFEDYKVQHALRCSEPDTSGFTWALVAELCDGRKRSYP